MRFSTEAVCLVLISDDPAILLIIFLAGAFFVWICALLLELSCLFRIVIEKHPRWVEVDIYVQLFFARKILNLCAVHSNNVADLLNLGTIFDSFCVEHTIQMFVLLKVFAAPSRVQRLVYDFHRANVPIRILVVEGQWSIYYNTIQVHLVIA